jgi:hypothetical protein
MLGVKETTVNQWRSYPAPQLWRSRAASPHIKIHMHNCQIHFKITVAAVAAVAAVTIATGARVLDNRIGMLDNVSLNQGQKG